MFNLEVNGQKASYIELTISPFVKDIKVSLKIYASVECGGISCLQSKTKEYMFEKDSGEAFCFFLDKLSEELGIRKGLLMFKLYGDYDSLYERVCDLRVTVEIAIDEESNQIAIWRHQDNRTSFLDKDTDKVEIFHDEIL